MKNMKARQTNNKRNTKKLMVKQKKSVWCDMVHDLYQRRRKHRRAVVTVAAVVAAVVVVTAAARAGT